MIVAICTGCTPGEVIPVPEPPPPWEKPITTADEAITVSGSYLAKTSSTSAIDPGSGKIAWATAAQSDSTSLFISKMSAGNVDFSNVWGGAITGRKILVQLKSDNTRKCVYVVNSVVNHTTWYALSVTSGATCAGLPFANNADLAVALLDPGV